MLFVLLVILLIVINIVIYYFCLKYFLRIRAKKYKKDVKKLEKEFYKTDTEKIKIPILYINLDRSVDRKKFIEKQLKKVSDNYTRVSAIDGKKITNIKKGVVDGVDYANEYHKLSTSELACLMSHIKAIKIAYEKGYDKALILEDDAVFYLKPLWEDSLDKITEMAPKDWEIIKLFSHGGFGFSCNNFKKDFQKIKLNDICTGATAYIINKSGMEKILNYTKPYINIKKNYSKGPADFFIYSLTNSYNYGIPLFLTGDYLLPVLYIRVIILFILNLVIQ